MGLEAEAGEGGGKVGDADAEAAGLGIGLVGPSKERSTNSVFSGVKPELFTGGG